MANMRGRNYCGMLLACMPFLFAGQTLAQSDETDIFQYVDPLIGTINGGHVFPGATLPFGMAKAVADTNGGDGQGGYASNNGDSEYGVMATLG